MAYIPSSSAEIRAAERLHAQLTASRITPEVADLLEQYAATWPTMTAQAAVGLAMQGLDPNSEMAQQVAQMEGLELLPETRDHRGIFAKVRDTAIGAAGDVVGFVGDVASTAVKGGARATFTLFDSAQQELIQRPLRALAHASYQSFGLGEQGFGDALGEGFAKSGNSAGVIALRDLSAGRGVDLGSGFFPGGQVAAEAQQQQEQIQIAGSTANFGDLVATVGFDPESAEHQLWSGILQMGFDIASDPTAAVGGAATKVRKAKTALGQTKNLGFGMHVGNTVDAAGRLRLGLVDESKTVIPAVVSAYTRSEDFAPIADKILDSNLSNYDVAQAFGHKVDPYQIKWLRESASRDELAGRIDEMILGKAPIGRQKVSLRSIKEPSRWGSILPTDTVNLAEGSANAAKQLDRALVAAKVSREQRARVFDMWTELPPPNSVAGRAEAKRIITEGYKAIESRMVADGVDPELALSLTRVWGRTDDMTKYVRETLGDNPLLDAARSKVSIDGVAEDVDFRLLSEVAQEFPLPNIRQISLEMTGGAMNSKVFKSTYAAELAVSETVLRAWVPLQLLRGAWTVRVVGEEQIRMAVSGGDSLFRHPASFIAWAMGKKGDTDALGKAFADDELHIAAQADTFDAWFKSDAGKVATGYYTITKPGEPNHWRNVVHTLRQLHDDPIMRRVASGQSTDEMVEWLFSEEGANTLRDLASTFPREVAEGFATDPTKVRAYIDGFAREAVSEHTKGIPQVLDLVATGRLDGVSFKSVRQRVRGEDGVSASSLMARKVRALLPEAPAQAVGPVLKDATHLQRLDELVDVGMTVLMGKPTNYLSRSPTFRQQYWKSTLDLVGGMSQEVRDKMLKNAEKAFAGKGFRGGDTNELVALRKAVRDTPVGSDITSVHDLDRVAKAEALSFTRDLLYDQARRHQWVDLSRGIFVFAEAWREIATTWLKLGSAQPTIARRAQQGIEGLRDAGVFYTDEQSGDEMFAYPLGGWGAKAFGAVGAGISAVMPADFGAVPFETDPEFGEVGIRQTAPVASLNLFSQSVLPGVGPVVSVAAAQLLPDVPQADWLRDVLFPFGDQDMDETPGGIVNSLLPSWMKKMWQGWTGGEIDRGQYANARFDVIRALSMRDPERYAGAEGHQRLLEDSAGIASNLFAIRATEQFLGAPAAPRTEFFVRDMNGQAFNFAALTSAYWDLFEASGGDHAEATRAFLDRFGVSPDLLRQGKTRSVNKRAITKPGAEWERNHQAQADKFPEVIGYFAPEDFDDEWDSGAFDRAIASGDREQLSVEVMVKMANQRVGYLAFEEATRRLEAAGLTGKQLTDAQREVRKAIADEYPGFNETLPIKGRLKPTEAIGHLKAALDDPTLASTEVGKGLSRYLKARDAFLAEAAKRYGVSTLSGKRVLPFRRALAEIAQLLVAEHEGFATVWDEVLSAEIKADELEQEPANG